MDAPLVTFHWPELKLRIRCALLTALNPGLCELLLRSLPLFSVQTHAVVAGRQVYFPTRLALEDPSTARTEDMAAQPPGRVNFEPFFQYVSLNYGPVSESVPAWPIAQVVEEDLPQLQSLGERVWENLLHEDRRLHVVVAREGQSPELPTADGRAHTPPTDAMTPRELARYLAAETDRIWLREPDDALRLRSGRSGSEAGVGGQYFSPWVMVTGLIRSLAVVEVAALRRMAAGERAPAPTLAEMLAEMLRVPSGVTGYFGLPELGGVLNAVKASCPRVTDAAELRELLAALAPYLNRYNLWLHQGFPWRLGDGFPREPHGSAG